MSHLDLSGRTVLVTGHTGFKGAWLSLWLLRRGADVVGYSLDPPTDPSLFAAAGLGHLLTDVRADVRDTATVHDVLGDHQPDVVFHLAAHPLVRQSYVAPHDAIDVNVMGTVSVLEAVRRSRTARAVVVVSSDKCYEPMPEPYGHREHDRLGGHDPYSASKAAMELLVQAYRRSFFGDPTAPRLATVRAGNVIGGGDWAADRLLPDCMRQLRERGEVRLRHPDAVRPWQHVLEPLSGYLDLASRLTSEDGHRFTGAWNFGPATPRTATVAEVAELAIDAWGSGSWSPVPGEQAYELPTLRLSVDKATVELGWQAAWGLDEAVRRTVSWYRAFESVGDQPDAVRGLCLRDIEDHERASSRG